MQYAKFEPNRGGHAPGHLREQFVELVCDDTDATSGAALREVAGKLWNCTDIMPGDVCETLEMQLGSTYAMGSRKVLKGTQ